MKQKNVKIFVLKTIEKCKKKLAKYTEKSEMSKTIKKQAKNAEKSKICRKSVKKTSINCPKIFFKYRQKISIRKTNK